MPCEQPGMEQRMNQIFESLKMIKDAAMVIRSNELRDKWKKETKELDQQLDVMLNELKNQNDEWKHLFEIECSFDVIYLIWRDWLQVSTI